MSDPSIILNPNNAKRVYTYPSDIYSFGERNFFQMNIIKYDKKAVGRFETTDLKETIRLPMPKNLSYGDSLEWEEFSSGLLGNLAAGVAGDFSLLGVAKAGGLAAVEVAANKIKDDGKTIASFAGVSINPRNTNVFKSPKMREMQYEFNFVARNKRESDEIKVIEDLLRYRSYPAATLNTEALFGAPELFLIRFLTNDKETDEIIENPYLPKPLPAILVGINVDYLQGEAAFFKNSNAPVDIKMTLFFKEAEYDTKVTLDERYKIVGRIV